LTALAGQVAAVTGGARGIGLAIATALAASGARVVIGDLDGDLAASAAAALSGPAGAQGLALDVRDESSYAAFLASVGNPDIVVNNAGIAVPGSFVDLDPARIDLQVAVNLGGVLRGLRLVLPGMLARGSGRILTISSAAGRIPSPGAAVYTATKHAVFGLNDAVRSEVRGSGVHLTAVLPTVVATEMSAGLRLRGLPAVTPDTVARAVLRVLRSRRPPASVMVPRWIRLLALGDTLAPQVIRDRVRDLISVDPGRGRRPYDDRIARLLEP
jgi:NAD(P)-dependent dehydrogenase (short-subunit alcohol dehydrogenase family)